MPPSPHQPAFSPKVTPATAPQGARRRTALVAGVLLATALGALFSVGGKKKAPAPSASAGDARRSARYEVMASDIRSSGGVRPERLTAIARWFDAADPSSPRAKSYAEMGPQLEGRGVRLLVVPVGQLDLELATEAHAASRRVLAALFPGGSPTVFANPLERMHVTVFHASHPDDPLPSDPSVVAEELTIVRSVVAAAQTSPELVVDRLVVTAAGVVLLLLRDPGGVLDQVRKQLRREFAARNHNRHRDPGDLIHMSLARVIDTGGSVRQDPEAALAEAARATQLLRGRRLHAKHLLFVTETVFANLEGKHDVVPFPAN
eukprot:TRINITY_DN50724_c0_g1_i1.p1 TRINITY_DN50724_c0_g1~~TRINITY_DN50724_c0_g1_i1.p1  ORF type:complete len:343 (+),score=86.50 TRINITY_DN50724_c0_g1_i1:75-1031(+)